VCWKSPSPRWPAWRICKFPRATASCWARGSTRRRLKALPVLLFFHGGGFTVGSVATHDILCRQLSLLAGIAVVSLDYRLAPAHKFPTAANDAWDALQWLAGHAAATAWTPRASPWAATAPAARWPPCARCWRVTPACRWPCNC
jgi:acetyl esterase/lipase